SIVEAEVRYGPDRPYVSAVYTNRLKRGMALQADPTIIYAYGRRLHRIWERQLQIRSPYNTYLYPGLPPGPINQPRDSSVIAAAAVMPPIPITGTPSGARRASAAKPSGPSGAPASDLFGVAKHGPMLQ